MKITIRDLQQRAHNTALDKGWWPYPTDDQDHLCIPTDSIAAKLALVHSEISEAVEEVRSGNLTTYWMWAGIRCDDPAQLVPDSKPEGLPIELADAVIRIADLCGALGIDLEGAIDAKLAYNMRRTHRHGGRAL